MPERVRRQRRVSADLRDKLHDEGSSRKSTSTDTLPTLSPVKEAPSPVAVPASIPEDAVADGKVAEPAQGGGAADKEQAASPKGLAARLGLEKDLPADKGVGGKEGKELGAALAGSDAWAPALG